MANYVLLFNRGNMPQTEAERATLMQAWGAWFGGLGDALVNHGNRFTPKAKSIMSDGTVNDVPADTLASGYSIVKADSLDEAIEMTKSCPALQNDGGQVTVYEIFTAT